MMTVEQRPEYVSKAGLKTRGWTDKTITMFLGEPDKTVKNPHYSKAAPMRLYLKTRVEQAEKSEKYKAYTNKNAAKREVAVAAAGKAVETKKKRLLEELAGWEIEIEVYPYEDVKAAAIHSYNDFHEEMLVERGHDYIPARMDSDVEFLQRITVNYLRHELSDYDYRLEALFGKVGKDEAYSVLNKKIYDKIAEAYPQLSAECQRQMIRKG